MKKTTLHFSLLLYAVLLLHAIYYLHCSSRWEWHRPKAKDPPLGNWWPHSKTWENHEMKQSLVRSKRKAQGRTWKAPSAGGNALTLPGAEGIALLVASVQGRSELRPGCRSAGFHPQPLSHQMGGRQQLKDIWMEGLAGYIA